MLTRRAFGVLAGAGVVSAAVASWADAMPAARRCSVMVWTLKGSFEERLETAAQAGYGRVELVDEFRKWTEGGTGCGCWPG